ncbi:MAG TPA: PDZ domain-containing protein, partial [Pirellulales bacterium]|nr:PDZ domain-containing protein [Pirellulales bacterium]
PDPRGCRVVWVVANGAADLAGIEVDDVITRIGTLPVRDLQGMIGAIAKFNVGDRARIEFLRGSETLCREVVFGEMQLDLLR